MCTTFLQLKYVYLNVGFYFYSQFLHSGNSPCPRVPAFTVGCVQGSQTRKSSAGQGWALEDYRFRFCQETHRQVNKYATHQFLILY